MDTGYWDAMRVFKIPSLPRTTDFFFWSYDDGTEAAAAIDQDSAKERYAKVFDDKIARKQYQERIQMQNEKEKLNFEKNKLTLKSGLAYAEPASGNRKEIAAAAKPHL